MLSSTVRSSTRVISWNAVWMPRACDARGDASRRCLAEDPEAAGVGQDEAGEQLDDGRLAGAVLAEQRVHAAARQWRRRRHRPRRSRRRPCGRARWQSLRRRTVESFRASRTCRTRWRAAGRRSKDAAARRPVAAYPAINAGSGLGLADERGLQADLRRLRRDRSRRTSRGSAPATAGRRCSRPSSPPRCLPCSSLIVSLVTSGSGSVVSFGTSLPSSFCTASFSA